MKTENKVIETRMFLNESFCKILTHDYYISNPLDYEDKIYYLHNEDILFVINTFRKIGKEGYDKFGGVKEIVKHNEDDFVEIKIQHGNDRNSYGFAELCIYNNKSGPSINFQYDVDDPMNPEDSLYKFLMELEKYVPEEDKEKIIPQWR